MRHLLTLALAASALMPALPALADQTLDVTSSIAAVTVYPDRAQIRRVAHVNLTPGTYTVRFNKLPAELMADTVRVGGKGTASVLIHGFDLKTTYLGQSPDAQVAQLESQMDGIKDKLRTLNDQRAVHERQLGMLVSTSRGVGESLAKQLAAGKAKTSEWQTLLAFLKDQQLAESTAVHNIDRQRQQVDKQKNKLQAKLDKLRGFRQKEVRQVPVTVEVKRGGTLDLDLDYVVPGARWMPTYDARLSPGGDSLEWHYYGVVSQQTGEDWTGVHLDLSTARPAAGSTPPVLPSWFLSLYQPPMEPMAAGSMAMNNVMPAPAPKPHASRARRKADEDARDEEMQAAEPVAAVTDQGTSVTLSVPRDVTIPSDGEPHQTPVGQAMFKPKTSYKVVPRVSPDAYLMVETTHTGPWPILPGAVKGFVGQDYVGTTMLSQDISAGQHFSLPLGVDRGIQVRRTRLDKTIGEAGLLRKAGFAQYKYEVTLANFKPRAQVIQVVEPVPQSTEDMIRILVDAGNQPQMANNPPGEARWELKLQPGEKKKLHWGYRVEYPQGQIPSGLE